MVREAGMGAMLAASAMLVVLPACQWAQEHPKTATGAGLGAAGGAIAGGLISGRRKGMVWGGLLGALAGGLLGAYADHKDRSAEATRADANYDPQSGVQLMMKKASVEPKTVSPGQEVDLKMTYVVLAPQSQQEVKLTERRVVQLNGETEIDHGSEVYRTSGTWSSTQPVTLPANAPSGTYEFKATVTSGNAVQHDDGDLHREVSREERAAQRTPEPGAMGLSGVSTTTLSPSCAASSMPSLLTPRRTAGSRFATTTICLPFSSS